MMARIKGVAFVEQKLAEAYQKLIPTRTAGADVVFTGYDL